MRYLPLITLLSFGLSLFALVEMISLKLFEPKYEKSTSPSASFLKPSTAAHELSPPSSILSLDQNEEDFLATPLKNELSYLGCIDDPDKKRAHAVISLNSSGERKSLSPEEFLFLSEDPYHKLHFSQTPSAISISLDSCDNNSAKISIWLKEKEPQKPKLLHRGEFLKTIAPLAEAKYFSKHLKWLGYDAFLKTHGGEEYAYLTQKPKIVSYASLPPIPIYLTKDKFYHWDGTFWKETDNHEGNFPAIQLLECKKDSLFLRVWDSAGVLYEKISLPISTEENYILEHLSNSICPVRLKTKNSMSVRFDDVKMTISSGDWVLFHDSGWRLLDSTESIEAYVDEKTPGYLFVADEIIHNHGIHTLKAHLYNLERTTSLDLEIPLDIRK